MSAATRNDISHWLDRLYDSDEFSHMVVFCDDFDYSDAPAYVPAGEDVREWIADYRKQWGSLYRVMEVYSRNHGKEEQLAERRAFHYD